MTLAAAGVKARRPAPPRRNFASRVFGYDVFISFALGLPPRGTHSYASDLARRLRERDFSVFFSEDEAAPGEQLDSILLNALHRSRTLVLIANRDMPQEPRWVRQEVEAFRSRHSDRPIIPISVGGALQDVALAELTRQWLPFDDKIWLDESHETVTQGIASDAIVARLAMARAGRSSNLKWRWVVRAIVAVLIILLGAATSFGIYARKESNIAIAKAKEAQENADRAEEQRLQAVSAKKSADNNAKKAQDSATEANRQKGIAEKETIIAQRRARESKGRELAAYANTSLDEDPERNILLSMYAVDSTVRFHEPPVSAAEVMLHQSIQSSRVRLTLRGHSDARGVAFSPDGKRLATASFDNTAKIWDAGNRLELLALRGHSGGVDGVAFSPNGKSLATAGRDGTAKVWDAGSGRELLTLRGHSGELHGVAFSPDGKRLATDNQGLRP
jgi:hypothetical protein